jgi:hypothetical protein
MKRSFPPAPGSSELHDAETGESRVGHLVRSSRPTVPDVCDSGVVGTLSCPRRALRKG